MCDLAISNVIACPRLFASEIALTKYTLKQNKGNETRK